MKVLKFGATWCGSCTMLGKTLSSIDHAANVIEVDVDKEMELAMKYQIRGVPTLVRIDDEGTEISRLVGAQTKSNLTEFLM